MQTHEQSTFMRWKTEALALWMGLLSCALISKEAEYIAVKISTQGWSPGRRVPADLVPVKMGQNQQDGQADLATPVPSPDPLVEES